MGKGGASAMVTKVVGGLVTGGLIGKGFMRPVCLVRVLALLVAIASLSACTGLRGPDLTTPTSTPSSANAAVAASLNAADAELARFFDDPHWEGFRNLTAGARGVFLAPRATSAGFIVGAEFANGVILARHGSSWSDPVFVRLSNYDVGLLAGAERPPCSCWS